LGDDWAWPGRGCMETTYSHGGELFLVLKSSVVLGIMKAGGGANVSFSGGQGGTRSFRGIVAPNRNH
jgi:hypothetical protein